MMRSIGRGKIRRSELTEEDTAKESLSKYFANIVTSPYKQDVSCLMVGGKGTGKSYASLSISYRSAEQISEIAGGKPNDYFNIDHVACVAPQMANELITKCEKNCVYMYDDIGLGWNARKWQSDENSRKNDIFQINRVDQTLQLFSVPNQFLLDKIPRSLVSHYCETDRQFFSRGFVTIKMFKPRTLFREGKIIQPYISTANQKYVIYAITKPPQSLCDEYDELRYKVTKKIIADRAIDKDEIPKQRYVDKRRGDMENRINDYLSMRENGVSKKEALHTLGIPYNTFRYWVKSGHIDGEDR